jgi:hypothetical protein
VSATIVKVATANNLPGRLAKKGLLLLTTKTISAAEIRIMELLNWAKNSRKFPTCCLVLRQFAP